MAPYLKIHLAPPKAVHGPDKVKGLPQKADQTYHDKYVVLYDFSGLEYDAATKEFNALLDNLEAAGLDTEVRPGYDQTILVLVKASRQLLGNAVYKFRVRDWLYGITQVHPGGDKDTVMSGWCEAEDLLTAPSRPVAQGVGRRWHHARGRTVGKRQVHLPSAQRARKPVSLAPPQPPLNAHRRRL